MADLVLDSGGVIAYERNERRFWTAVTATLAGGGGLIIPAPVLAQCWRGQVQVARLVKAAEVLPMDAEQARAAGTLCGRCKTSDIVDAVVAVIAAEAHADVATSDPEDLRVLLRQAGGTGRILEI